LHPLAFPLSRRPALTAALLGEIAEGDYDVSTKCRDQALVLLFVKLLGEQMLIQPKLVQKVTILRPEASHFGVGHLLTVRHRGVAVGKCICDANKVIFHCSSWLAWAVVLVALLLALSSLLQPRR